MAVKISIIIPVYNVKDYLSDCLHSVLGQSFKDIEVVLVNDGSTDGSGDICDRFAAEDERIRVIHKQNGGQAQARNMGLDVATGEVITFIDSDDLIEPDSLEALYKCMCDEGADIVMGSMLRFAPDGTTRPYTRMDRRMDADGKGMLCRVLAGKELNISPCAGLYRRHIFDSLRFPEGMVCEDWYVTPAIYMAAKKAVFLPVPWYRYRVNDASTMGALQTKGSMDVLAVAQHVLDEIKAADPRLYEQTRWFNLKRVWKWVGIFYTNGTKGQNVEFMAATRALLRRYWPEVKKDKRVNLQEKIGIFNFCYCEPLCSLLYKLK